MDSSEHTWSFFRGDWSLENGLLQQRDTRPGRLAEARQIIPPWEGLTLSAHLRMLSPIFNAPGAFGLLLDQGDDEVLGIELVPRIGQNGPATAQLVWGWGEIRKEIFLDLPHDFNVSETHQIEIRVEGQQGAVFIDGQAHWQGRLPEKPGRAIFFTRGMSAEFSLMIKSD